MHAEKISQVRFVGKTKTRDITVDSDEHVFYANGVVVSNSHSFEYAAISGAEFWFKYHFPTEYLTALMNNASTSGGKGALPGHVKYINYARKMGIKVVSPSVNQSGVKFRIDDNGNIRFALSHIKQVGKSADLIEGLQPFSGMEDFFTRIPKRKINKRVVMSLLSAGAFDDFGERNDVLEKYIELRKEKTAPKLLKEDEWQEKEAEAVGICLTREPILLQYAQQIKDNRWCTIGEVKQRESPYVFGRIDRITRKTSKNGNEMMVVTLSDDMDEMRFYVWNNAFMKFSRDVKKGHIVAIPLQKFEDGDGRFFNNTKDITVVKR